MNLINFKNLISAYRTSETGFPVLWLFQGHGDMQYKGPNDINSLQFFLNEKIGRTSERKKVRRICTKDHISFLLN